MPIFSGNSLEEDSLSQYQLRIYATWENLLEIWKKIPGKERNRLSGDRGKEFSEFPFAFEEILI
jgi:hypothetical protein